MLREVAAANLRVPDHAIDTITGAAAAGITVVPVTTISAQNVAALLEALSPAIITDVFDVIVDAAGFTRVASPDQNSASHNFSRTDHHTNAAHLRELTTLPPAR